MRWILPLFGASSSSRGFHAVAEGSGPDANNVELCAGLNSWGLGRRGVMTAGYSKRWEEADEAILECSGCCNSVLG